MSDTTSAAPLQEIQNAIGDSGRDIRVNLETVLSDDGAPGLTRVQREGIALACAFATGPSELASAIRSHGFEVLTTEVVEAAKSAATIMAMNNVYYRAMHLTEDKSITQLPARLRMTVIGRPGIPKVDFELMSLAVSAIAGCGACINAHMKEGQKAGISPEGLQSAIRIAAVLNAAHQALRIAAMTA